MTIKDFENNLTQGILLHQNKTLEYLAPILKTFSPEFQRLKSELRYAGIYIGDCLCDINDGHYLFMVINVSRSNQFNKDINLTIQKLKETKYYVHDYPLGEIYYGKLHVIVFEIEEEFQQAYQEFSNFTKNRITRYSRMYSKEQKRKLFNPSSKQYKVLVKNNDYKIEFEQELNAIAIHAASHGNVEYITIPEENELDYQPNALNEILNFKDYE